MSDTEINETIATFKQGGKTYEIDHLGIARPSDTCPLGHGQWGEFAVYCDGKQVAEFAIEESALKPEFRPAELPVTNEELIELAKQALALDEAHDAAGS